MKPYLVVIFCAVILFLSVWGLNGKIIPSELNMPKWTEMGPFGLSPERGRFALTYSLIEDKSFYFSVPLARFALPDVSYRNGKYVSMFAPGVSFFVLPGYLIGRLFSVPQVGTFLVISTFAILNSLLIYAIAVQIGTNKNAGIISGLLFLFATPAFAYSVTLYQHHISIFLILLSIYLLMKYKNKLWSWAVIWFLCALAVNVDYPNVVMMAPIGLIAFAKLFVIRKGLRKFKFTVRVSHILPMFSVILPLVFFIWFNLNSYGKIFQLSGTVGGVKAIDEQGNPSVPTYANPEGIEEYLNPEKQKKNAWKFFQTRGISNAFYLQFFSPDRGIIYFTPVILLGVVGAVILYCKKNRWLLLLLSVLSVNILLYSMWGDPWGGWAFGSRYLIPSYAILAIFIAVALTKFKKNKLFLGVFFALLVYSIAVNSLGALTTNRNPPQVEVLALEKLSGREEKYTYARNIDYLLAGNSKSFVFQAWAKKYISAKGYYLLVTLPIIAFSGVLLVKLYKEKNEV